MQFSVPREGLLLRSDSYDETILLEGRYLTSRLTKQVQCQRFFHRNFKERLQHQHRPKLPSTKDIPQLSPRTFSPVLS